ncbi:hypothetical protein SCHPADRAFT_905056 [Schizopora paradoxa]|uniref:Uncharacterized protein n=1 Tax=Schizopora paradoxa TaxID=27342 RepID=A0A0H2RKL5_9AGAM|nr:hypothetical protein SCHPADRAFT_905056 [Schizopora paradoxa]
MPLFRRLRRTCSLWLGSPVTYEATSTVSAIQMIAITLSSRLEARCADHKFRNSTNRWYVSRTRSEFPSDMTPTTDRDVTTTLQQLAKALITTSARLQHIYARLRCLPTCVIEECHFVRTAVVTVSLFQGEKT